MLWDSCNPRGRDGKVAFKPSVLLRPTDMSLNGLSTHDGIPVVSHMTESPLFPDKRPASVIQTWVQFGSIFLVVTVQTRWD